MIDLKVEGMSCDGCVRSVRAILAKTLGVDRDADADALARALTKLDAQGFPSSRS